MNENKVSFEEESYGQGVTTPEQGSNWMFKALLKVRWVENQTQAFYVILAIVILFLAVSVFIFVRSSGSSPQPGEIPPGETVPN